MKKLTEKLRGDLRDYRPIPFWSWNDDLQIEELIRQIDDMKENGIGGFFMHARGGLKTEYLGEKWFDCIRACVEESKKVGMNAWSYDENGWPSGFAGMKLLEDKNNHEKYLVKSINGSFDEKADAVYLLKNGKLSRVTESKGDGKYVNVYVKTNASVVDILDKNIVKQFIDLTHERYKKECGEDFGKYMLGFFTDEPQYYRWDTAYSPVLIPYFKEKYGIDLWDELGKLFVNCEGDYSFRYKYWNAMHRFFIDSYVKQIYEWCEKNGCQLTGHGVEESRMHMQMWCCAGIMEFYEYEHIPGIDWLGRNITSELMPKQVGSVCEQLGKKHVLTETFACCGWDVTPQELKRIAEWQYVNGVNLMCQHLSSYSIRGQRKRDYPLSYSEHMGWYERFGDFNDYFGRLGYLLSESRNLVDVLVVHPMKSLYLDYDRTTDNESVKPLELAFEDTIETLGARQIPHHYGDENLMKKYGKVVGGKLVVGNYSYKYVCLPKLIKNLDKSTLDLLVEFAANGGKLAFEGGKPEYLEGEEYAFDELKETCSYDEILSSGLYEISSNGATVRSAYREYDGKKFLYVVNLDEKDASVEIKTNSAYPFGYDLEKTEKYPLVVKDGNVVMTLEKGGSAIIFENDEPYEFAKQAEKGYVDISGRWNVVEKPTNSLTLDKAKLSYDGVNYGVKAYVPALFNELIKKRYVGKIFLKYDFKVKNKSDVMFLESERMDIVECKVNGESVRLEEKGTLDRSFLTCDIRDKVKLGDNEIVFECDFYERDYVHYVLSDVSAEKESLKNCLSYDTELESVYIRGDFCVYADDLQFVDDGIMLSDGDYYIDSFKPTVDGENLTADGYLFFMGKIQLEKKILIDKNASWLRFTGRKAVAEVFVDGERVGKAMFSSLIDLGKFADGKEHSVKVVLYSGNRNIYGPHHSVEYEPLVVAPWSFDPVGTWDDEYRSPCYRDNYSFVKFSVK